MPQIAVLAEEELEQKVKDDENQMSKYVDEMASGEIVNKVTVGPKKEEEADSMEEADSCGHATVSAAVLFAALQWL